MVELKKTWKKLTEGWFGYVFYAILGIIIAFLVNMSLATALSTDLPVVAVVSGSMDHGVNSYGAPCRAGSDYVENFDNWWDACKDFYSSIGITKEQFSSFPFKDGFKEGDMPIVKGSENYQVGDIIVFSIPTERTPIIHRIIKINADGTFMTKGDHNVGPNQPYELSVSHSQIHGKVIFIVPKLGYFKVILSKITGGLI